MRFLAFYNMFQGSNIVRDFGTALQNDLAILPNFQHYITALVVWEIKCCNRLQLLPIIYYLLPITYYLLPTTYHSAN